MCMCMGLRILGTFGGTRDNHHGTEISASELVSMCVCM